MQKLIKGSIIKGLLGTSLLLILYFIVVSQISGWQFAKAQFSQFWYYIVTLAFGFGIQVGLYSYLRSSVEQVSAKIVAATGTTSTAAMVSCCAHYLANILPILGITGAVTLITQYQIQLFLVGMIFNLAAVGYMVSKIIRFSKTA